ncbi:MAG: hypothetical protein IPL87_00920 [Candidatus Moraniibacteriota bacterium]|nr:MAG: hypothetical protein IPL87_00920 [Candidatus Moranbacteria bacterium]
MEPFFIEDSIEDKPYMQGAATSNLPDAGIYEIVAATMDWLLAILGFIAIIGFVIAGIMYLTAAGNDGQIKNAKQAMFYSIVGVIVALVGYVVIQAVDLWLNASSQF